MLIALEIIGGIILFLICLRFGIIEVLFEIIFAILSGEDSGSGGSGWGGGKSGGGGSSDDY